jgi:hypothetical protein
MPTTCTDEKLRNALVPCRFGYELIMKDCLQYQKKMVLMSGIARKRMIHFNHVEMIPGEDDPASIVDSSICIIILTAASDLK